MCDAPCLNIVGTVFFAEKWSIWYKNQVRLKLKSQRFVKECWIYFVAMATQLFLVNLLIFLSYWHFSFFFFWKIWLHFKMSKILVVITVFFINFQIDCGGNWKLDLKQGTSSQIRADWNWGKSSLIFFKELFGACFFWGTNLMLLTYNYNGIKQQIDNFIIDIFYTNLVKVCSCLI